MSRRVEFGPIWDEQIFALKGQNRRLGAGVIHRLLVQKFGESETPSFRTIGRTLKRFEALNDDEKQEYGLFYWPESMEAQRLPWEAGSVVLEILEHSLRRGSRPPVRLVKWFYRVTCASPDASLESRLGLAVTLAALEAVNTGKNTNLQEPARRVELFMACAPWKSNEQRDLYERVRRREHAEEFKSASISYPTNASPEEKESAYLAVAAGLAEFRIERWT